MGQRTAAVDAYIAVAPEYARPILERLHEAFHAGCPGFPSSALSTAIEWLSQGKRRDWKYEGC